jgi:hypothetical protein
MNKRREISYAGVALIVFIITTITALFFVSYPLANSTVHASALLLLSILIPISLITSITLLLKERKRNKMLQTKPALGHILTMRFYLALAIVSLVLAIHGFLTWTI